MSDLTHLLNGFTASWGAALWRASWQGGLALLAAAIIARALPRLAPHLRSWLWRLAFLKLLLGLVTLPTIALPVLPASYSPMQVAPAVSAGPALPAGAMAPPSSAVTAATAAPTAPSAPGVDPTAGLLALWVAAALGSSLYAFRSWRRASRLHGVCKPLEDAALREELAALCRRARVSPPELKIGPVHSPLLLGLRHPVIILPPAMVEHCDREEVRLMLAHEVAHLARRDVLWGFVLLAAQALFAFHPLVWLGRREWALAQESACDAAALAMTAATEATYGEMLVKVAAQPRTALPGPLVAGIAEPHHLLRRRLLAMAHLTPLTRRRLVLGGALVAALAVAVLAPWRAVARPQGITLSDLYATRDLPIARQSSVHWQPPSPAYVKAHTARPELPAMRPEFELWVKYLLQPRWAAAKSIAAAPYLRAGTGRESRANSHFYATYRREGRDFLVQGFLEEVQVTLKAPPEKLPARVQEALARAVALKAKTPPGQWGVSLDYGEPYPPEVKAYLRHLAETYLNPAALPADHAAWLEALDCVNTNNGGFSMQWNPTTLPPGVSPPVGEGGVFGSIWTNGRAVVVRLLHEHIWAHDFSSFINDVPKPKQVGIGRAHKSSGSIDGIQNHRQAGVRPLNPQAVEFWDEAQWYGPVGPVDNPARATSGMMTVVVKEPYAPHLTGDEEYANARTGGQPAWGNQFNLPMTDRKWHIAEFQALASAAVVSLSAGNWPETSFPETLSKATDRAAVLRDARKRRATCEVVAARYASLAYPREAKAQRDEMLAALQAYPRFWDATIAYWEPFVGEHPNESERFYTASVGSLEQQLQAVGLGHVGERLNEAVDACGVPLFQRFGLANIPPRYP